MRRKRIAQVLKNMLDLYYSAHIPMASGAFCYSLTLAIFPILICLHAMLGNLFPQPYELKSFLDGLLPEETIMSLVDYLDYVSQNHSTTMVVIALTAMASTSASAYRTLHRVMGEMWGDTRFEGIATLVFSFVFSIVFLLSVYASAILMATGKWFIELIDRYIMFVNISASWGWVRFILLFALLFVMIIGVYKFTAPKGMRIKMLPGAALASFSLVGVSIVFSYFIGASIKYHILYGSLASIMILMFWIYLCGIIVFLGNALNVSIQKAYTER